MESLRGVADGLGVSVAQAAIAWVACRGSDIVPLIGARSRIRLSEALGATGMRIDDAQLARIEAAAHMAALDSERIQVG